MQFVYVSCPLLFVENALGPGQTDINEQKRILTGGVTHEFRTNRKLTYEDRTLNGDLCSFYPVENFEHAQNSHRTERMSPDIAEQSADSPDMKHT
ncbi:hypothetical protein DPMN_144827 [Dreissena polymorpha]|uniref:Uncharacterized protein n=1 Tax=Dreissena polymorpha TaxID=45954 RepID=A0A9D4J0E7_DREPO|nr:hypothetical protein DPMN_144827 [Dreissena polymorpha]